MPVSILQTIYKYYSTVMITAELTLTSKQFKIKTMKKLVYLISFLMAVLFGQRTWAQSVSGQRGKDLKNLYDDGNLRK